jgi:hypothetical protein
MFLAKKKLNSAVSSAREQKVTFLLYPLLSPYKFALALISKFIKNILFSFKQIVYLLAIKAIHKYYYYYGTDNH